MLCSKNIDNDPRHPDKLIEWSNKLTPDKLQVKNLLEKKLVFGG